MPVNRQELVTGWELRLAGANPAIRPPAIPAAIPASVPGCVHTDLLVAGLIPDPYLDENELTLDWIGHQQWSYRTTFTYSPDGADQVELVCDGLDTVATVLVNGLEVGRFANQHRSYRIPIAGTLQTGDNEIEIVFDSAWAYAEKIQRELGNLPNAYPTPFNFIRKMACNFGWDWGPTVVTAGIWKPIAIESWSTARLSVVRPVATVRGPNGVLTVDVDVEDIRPVAAQQLSLLISIAGQVVSAEIPAGASHLQVEVEVPEVELWWPHDLGSQPLYDLSVELSTGDGLLDRWDRGIGFRNIRLDTTPDEIGSAFTLVVNEVPIFVRGANWIPDDCFPSRITSDRLRTRIEQSKGANINLLRVWGGGMYESDDFYGLCDELGVLVWQDFLFACAAYPEEEPIRGEVIAEATENVIRLMPHPSLVLWNGCNENIWGWFDWSWREPVGARTWGAGYYLEILPAIVAAMDPSRPYYPGSPFSGSMEIHPNVDNHGLRHIWDVWNDIDYSHYRDYVPRFVAEFGYQGPPNAATIERSIHDRPRTHTSSGMLHHQKATDGNGKLARGAAPHLPVIETFSEWHYLMQLNQAEAIRYGIEHFRSHRGVCMGTVVWQINDCWPVTSWAAIDGDGRKKLLWYALRDSYAPHLLTIQPREDGLFLFGVNDAGVSWRGATTVQRVGFDGTVLATFETRLVVDRLASASVELPERVTAVGDARSEYLIATATGGERALWFFAPDKDLALAPDALTAVVQQADHGIDVTVHATSLARHVTVMADRWHPDAVVDEATATIGAGGGRTFRITAPAAADAATFVSSGALMCLNDLLTTPPPGMSA
ncbi:beta-mannosidase [Nakamurella sp. UYEF19]|uniref:glycoside hydrolase family 2 protein n=1 Tax=Nakamurella sp. UYEF19 TaxID=1756392 RepID=UPI00339B1274